MKILHIASFNGNIGDNAHHNGFRKNFSEIIGRRDLKWTELEMRKFYISWNELKFDEEFIKEANKYDLIVIGGGNFFEICHEYSNTGCTVDLPPELLAKIKTPIFFNALGFDIHKGYSDITKNRFKKFMNYLLENDKKYFVTFRNDGSDLNYKKIYKELPDGIKIIPDGGFFLDQRSDESINKDKMKYIGINLACDMIEKRLRNQTYEEFCKNLSNVYKKFINQNLEYKLLFFPHILTDYKIIMDVLNYFTDREIKYNVEIAPYLTGQNSEKDFFRNYEKCDLLTGLRFHTNVCGVALNIPTIGLKSYPKLSDLYSDIGLKERCLDVDSENFFEEYYDELLKSLRDKEEIKEKYDKIWNSLKRRQIDIYLELREWLSNAGL